MSSDEYFVNELLQQQQDLLYNILRYKIIPKEGLSSINEIISTWKKKKPLTKPLIESFIPEVNAIEFDFLKIYEYYFDINDPYYINMSILLNISDGDAFMLNKLGKEHPIYGEHFEKIMAEARERKMVERVLAYMDKPNRRRKIVIFTGKRHVDNLEHELSKTGYTVKSRNL